MSGVIGGAKYSHLAVWDGNGGFSYNNDADNSQRVRRFIDNLHLNKDTGELSFDAYDDASKKVSSFSGILTIKSDDNIFYDGKFTNLKGVSMEVHLKGELCLSEPEGDWSDLWWY